MNIILNARIDLNYLLEKGINLKKFIFLCAVYSGRDLSKRMRFFVLIYSEALQCAAN